MDAVSRTSITKFDVTDLFSLTQPSYAILDAAGLPGLQAQLTATDLAFESLHVGDDAVALAHEAPYLVTLDPEAVAVWEPVLTEAFANHAAVLMQSDAVMDDVRRHWRKWLSVEIEEGKLGMFRFYDPRVMAAFLLTLTPAEVGAFFGPVDQIAVVRGDVLTQFTPSIEAKAVPPLRVPLGQFYPIRPEQTQAMKEVVSEQFKDDLFRFYRKIFEPEVAHLSDDELRGRIEQAIADTQRMGSSREADVIRMAAVRVLRPDIADDEWYWDQVMNHETNNVLMRASLFLAYLKHDMDYDTREEFDARMGLFGMQGFY